MSIFTSFFAGEGGTLRMAIFGSIGAALAYEISHSDRELSVTTSKGAAVSYTPSSKGHISNHPECTGNSKNCIPTEEQNTQKADDKLQQR